MRRTRIGRPGHPMLGLLVTLRAACDLTAQGVAGSATLGWSYARRYDQNASPEAHANLGKDSCGGLLGPRRLPDLKSVRNL